jgi:hypothetical protein
VAETGKFNPELYAFSRDKVEQGYFRPMEKSRKRTGWVNRISCVTLRLRERRARDKIILSGLNFIAANENESFITISLR